MTNKKLKQKPSVFDPGFQNQSTEAKIIVGLERIAESFRVALWEQSKVNNLSPIQVQILTFLAFHSKEKRKVSYLAHEFNLTKATISDAVKILLQKGLIEKEVEENDSRSYIISLSEKGKEISDKTAFFANGLLRPINELSEDQKNTFLESLLLVINRLQKTGVIQLQRMCLACVHLHPHADHYHCSALKQTMYSKDLRLDCRDFEKRD